MKYPVTTLFPGLAALLLCLPASAQDFRSSTGIVMADRSVTLASKIVGRISSVEVEEGDRVTAGQVLVMIEDAQVNADLASARAVLAQEEVRLEHMQRLNERYVTLLEQDSISETQADEALYNFEVARTSVDRARADVNKMEVMLAETEIRAPFDGVIIQKLAEAGKVTPAGGSLLVLEDQSVLKFRTNISELDIPYIEIGQEIPVTIDALGDEQLPGRVMRVVPSGDVQTHEFTVDLELPRRDKLYPGMFGKAEFSR